MVCADSRRPSLSQALTRLSAHSQLSEGTDSERVIRVWNANRRDLAAGALGFLSADVLDLSFRVQDEPHFGSLLRSRTSWILSFITILVLLYFGVL